MTSPKHDIWVNGKLQHKDRGRNAVQTAKQYVTVHNVVRVTRKDGDEYVTVAEWIKGVRQ